MKEITIIFPHQLYKKHPAIKSGRTVYLVEESLFFNQYNFHQQKIILHRLLQSLRQIQVEASLSGTCRLSKIGSTAV